MNQTEIDYWNGFYKKSKHIQNVECSDFCKYVMSFFQNEKQIKRVLDCGCGNGRDSICLSNVYDVLGIDSCGFMPDCKTSNCEFRVSDFTTHDKEGYQLVYSRFTFHSITNEQQKTFIESIRPGTFLAIETRSKKGELSNVFHGKEHYRNYTDLDYIVDLLKKNDFDLISVIEGADMAPYKDENPICIRIICKKK